MTGKQWRYQEHACDMKCSMFSDNNYQLFLGNEPKLEHAISKYVKNYLWTDSSHRSE